MKHRISYLFLLFVLLLIQANGSIYAQRNSKIIGNYHFKNSDYQLAISAYQQIASKDKKGKISKRIGLCYAHLHQPIKALIYLLRASEKGCHFKEHELLILGDILRQNKQYLAAKKAYHRMRILPYERIEACLWAQEFNQKNPFINISKIKQLEHPISISCFKENLFVLFSNNKSLFHISDKKKQIVDTGFPTHMNYSAPCINKDSTTLYFSSNASNHTKYNNKNKKNRKISRDGINNLFIWEYKIYDKNNFLNGLPFNNRNYSCTHPYYDQNTKRLYFTSNMPGGYGGFDIYYSKKTKGHWSKPINLGPFINTPENESYPYIHQGKLYYSSRKYMGYGGYDIFVYDLLKPKQAPHNMGLPINSPFDDFSLKFINDTTGFLLSKRDNPQGTNNIYKVDISKTPIEQIPPIFFGYNQVDISLIEELKLKKIYSCYLAEKNMLISIEGHTDNRGSREYNMSLSLERAQNVAIYLQKLGIPSEKIILEGRGEDVPINICTKSYPCSEEKHGENRRAVITIHFNHKGK